MRLRPKAANDRPIRVFLKPIRIKSRTEGVHDWVHLEWLSKTKNDLETRCQQGIKDSPFRVGLPPEETDSANFVAPR
jgi:hypothetical protein